MTLRRATLTVRLDQTLGTVSPRLWGKACWNPDGHVWVGEDSPIPNTRGLRNDVITALGNLAPHALSFPLPVFYRWQDGIGPRDQRPKRFWGFGRSAFEAQSTDRSNDFGTDEFIDLCRLTYTLPAHTVSTFRLRLA